MLIKVNKSDVCQFRFTSYGNVTQAPTFSQNLNLSLVFWANTVNVRHLPSFYVLIQNNNFDLKMYLSELLMLFVFNLYTVHGYTRTSITMSKSTLI